MSRAEAILLTAENSKKKSHGPTIDYFRGQVDALRKIMQYADAEKPQQNPGDVMIWYVSARADGWMCTPFFPEGDHWEQALLTKENLTAQVDIVAGHVTMWRDGQEIQPTFPYEQCDKTSSRSCAGVACTD